MSAEKVRVLTDLKSEAFYETTIDKVPNGYVRIHLKDRGEFYADTRTENVGRDTSRGHFPEEVMMVLRRQHGHRG